MTEEILQKANALQEEIKRTDSEVKCIETLRDAGGITIVPTGHLKYDYYDDEVRCADREYFTDLDEVTSQRVIEVIIQSRRQYLETLKTQFANL